MYYLYLLKVYKQLYEYDRVVYRGTLGSLKVMIQREWQVIQEISR